LERTPRAFFITEKHGIGFIGRIIHGDNEIPHLPRNPLVAGAILVEHHPRQRLALTFTAMLSALFGLYDHASVMELIFHAGIAQLETMLRQLFVKMFNRKIMILSLVQREQPHRLIRRNSLGRQLADTSVNKTTLALVLIAPAHPVKGAHGNSQDVRCHVAPQFTFDKPTIYIEKPHL
jgi:hypothetical protein